MSSMLLCLSNYPRELVENWVHGLDVEVVLGDELTESDILAAMAKAQVVIGDAARRFPLDAARINGLDACRVIIQPSVGLDGVVDIQAARAARIEVRNTPGYNASAVADWAVMGMLVALRSPVTHDRILRSHGWHQPALGRELAAQTVGIVGYGAIGRAVRERLSGFGCSILVHSRSRVEEATVTEASLEELLRESDIVTLHVPYSQETHHLLDQRKLALMRPHSVLVNTARGSLVDEHALADALAHGRPSFAVLDVFENEPLPGSSPLLQLPNTLLSPHVAASTHEARARVRSLVGTLVAESFSQPVARQERGKK